MNVKFKIFKVIDGDRLNSQSYYDSLPSVLIKPDEELSIPFSTVPFAQHALKESKQKGEFIILPIYIK